MSALSSQRLDVFGGTGIGLLTGLLVGLSTSPIVGTVLGGILTLGVLWLGFEEVRKAGLEDSDPATKLLARRSISMRMGCFGLACAGGVLAGLYLRTNNALAPSIRSQRDEWADLLRDRSKEKRLATAFLMQRKLQGGDVDRRALTTMLFSDTETEEPPIDTDPDAWSRISQLVEALEDAGEPWATLASKLASHDESTQRLVLECIHALSNPR